MNIDFHNLSDVQNTSLVVIKRENRSDDYQNGRCILKNILHSDHGGTTYIREVPTTKLNERVRILFSDQDCSIRVSVIDARGREIFIQAPFVPKEFSCINSSAALDAFLANASITPSLLGHEGRTLRIAQRGKGGNPSDLLAEILTKLKTGQTIIRSKNVQGKVVAFLGMTGAGKSTLGNVINDCPHVGVQGSGGRLYYGVEDPVFPISHETESCTFIPGAYCPCEKKYTYLDLAGDYDTARVKEGESLTQEELSFKRAVYDIVNRFYRDEMFRSATKLKIVLVIPHSDLTDTRINHFRTSVESLINFLGDYESEEEWKRVLSSIALVVTKVQDGRLNKIEEKIPKLRIKQAKLKEDYKRLTTDDQGQQKTPSEYDRGRLSCISEKLERVERQIDEKTQASSAIYAQVIEEIKARLKEFLPSLDVKSQKILQHIITHDRLAIFRAPGFEGAVTSEEEKAKILDLIHSKCFYVSKGIAKLRTRVNADHQLRIVGAIQYLQSQIKTKLSSSILNHLEKTLRNQYELARNENEVQELAQKLRRLVGDVRSLSLGQYLHEIDRLIGLERNIVEEAIQFDDHLLLLSQLLPEEVWEDYYLKNWVNELEHKTQFVNWASALEQTCRRPKVERVGESLLIKGYFVKMSALKQSLNEYGFAPIRSIMVFALHSFTIDDSLRLPGASVGVFSPKWFCTDEYTIDLSGRDAEALPVLKAADGQDQGEGGAQDGKDGLPGRPGEHGGHFFGIGDLWVNIEGLTLRLSGGSGGNGQNGGDGKKGREGRNAYIPPSKKYVISYGGLGIPEIYFPHGWTEGCIQPHQPDGRYHVTNRAVPDERGGDGGKGGRGGIKGESGTCTLISLSPLRATPVIPERPEVKDGTNGEAGKVGDGGTSRFNYSATIFLGSTIVHEAEMGDIQHHHHGFTPPTQYIEIVDTHYTNPPSTASFPPDPPAPSGRHPEELNEHNIERPPPRPELHISRQLIEYRKYVASQSHNFLSFPGLKSFLERSDQSTIPVEISFTSLFDEVQEIEQWIKHFNVEGGQGKRIDGELLYRSLAERIKNYTNRPGTDPEVIIALQYLYALVLSRMSDLQEARENRLVIDVDRFLEQVQGNIAAMNALTREVIIRQHQQEYTDPLWAKIDEAQGFITRLTNEIKRTSDKIDKSIINLLGQIREKIATVEQSKEKMIESREQLKVLISQKGVFGVLSILTQGIGVLLPPGGPIIAGLAQSGMAIARDPSNWHQQIGNILGQTRQISSLIQKWESFFPSFSSPSSSSSSSSSPSFEEVVGRAERVYEQARPFVDAGIDLAHQIASDEAKIDQLNHQIAEAEAMLVGLNNYQREMCDGNFRQLLRNFENQIINTTEGARGQSIAALDFKLHEVKDFFEQIRQTIQGLTRGFAAGKEIVGIFEQMDQALQAAIKIYKTIERYQDQITLASYLAKLHLADNGEEQALSPQYQPAILEMKRLIRRSLLLNGYVRATSAVEQWAFPFAHLFCRGSEDLEAFKGVADERILIEQMVLRITTLREKLGRYRAEINPQIDNAIIQGPFASALPFYTWQGSEALLEGLFEGEPMTLYADVRKSPAVSAVKFRKIRVEIVSDVEGLQRVLQNYQVVLSHPGRSYYQFRGNIYPIAHNENLEILHGFQIEQGNVFVNGTATRLEEAEPLLSPYTQWTIQIRPNPGYQGNLSQEVRGLLTGLKIRLVGEGTYVNEAMIRGEVDLQLDRYYNALK